MSKISYLIDLASQQYDETDTGASSWIMCMPIGNYTHDKYGKINITPERVQRFAANVNNHVRGIDLDIDYDHKEYSGEAAGWVKQAEPRSDGLWILVEWTKKAYEAIKSKAYRYFSPEFDDTWRHPSTGEKYVDVLFGGGITNRPFLKGIKPLNLSEFYNDESVAFKENGSMTPEQVKELAAKLGLSEDATAEMVFGALSMHFNTLGASAPEPPAENENETSSEAESTNESEQLVTAQLSELANNPVVKKLTEKLEKANKTLSDMILAGHVKKLHETAQEKGRIIAPTIETGITKLLSESPSDEYTETLIKTLSEMLGELGPISGETTARKHLSETDSDTSKKFTEKIQKYATDNKLSFSEAAVQIAAMEADLFDEYRKDTYIPEGE